MKILSFPDFGCGGIICSLLNNEPLKFYHLGHTESHGHALLKEVSHTAAFDAARFAELLAKRADYTGWAGTHCHPKNFLELDSVEEVLYVKCSSAESKGLIALRQLEFTHGLDDPYKVETILAARWFWPTDWQVSITHPKVRNVELYDFYADRDYRQQALGVVNEDVYAQWFARNNYMRYMPQALQVYSEMLTRKHEYMTV